MSRREQFEAWAAARFGITDFSRSAVVSDMYYNNRLDDMWKGYQAGRAEAEALLREIVRNPGALRLPRDYSPATEDLHNRLDAFLKGGTT